MGKAFAVQVYGAKFESPEPHSTPQQSQPSWVKTGEPAGIMG